MIILKIGDYSWMEQIEWDFDSGNLVLDFANTTEFHASDHPDEHINSYTDLLSWAESAGLLTHSEGMALLDRSNKEPEAALIVLEKALEFRELIYRIFSSIASDQRPSQADLSVFNEELTKSLKNTFIINNEHGYSWGWQNMKASLGSMLWPIAREAANLLTSQDLNRIGECADDRGCGYLFVDTSRNRSRRWCSMEDCGNRAKAQRHYQKISKNRTSP
jgi:predicted RNA-binding Zn ribbon-like protein